ncbi:hypothetical protein M9Y10_037379 [Tritrichomonas musculus]|uniref:Myb-like domain-containing protein n=1 Tax=Tritrichomonas musculus TaxID=1915356 RepID=A0ABR2GUI6_9EUKA
MRHYKRKYIEVSKKLQEFKNVHKNIDLLSWQYPYWFKHISSLNLQENNPNAKNGNRFDEENIPLYILISMAGEYFTDILYQLFGYPSSRQCRNLKKKFREKYGIIDNILNGSYESLSQLFSLFWKSQDKRFIVAVDTASVNAQV